MEIKTGDIVTRLSYKCDLLFRVRAITGDIAELTGKDMRLLADAPLEDLKLIGKKEQHERQKKAKEKEEHSYRLFRQDAKLMRQRNEFEVSDGYYGEASYFELRGRVLHIDGDSSYLQKCIHLYDRVGIPVYGVHLNEKEMPEQIGSLLEMVQPDIVVITGHDAYLKTKGDKDDLKAYRHTKYFAECVRIARKHIANKDQLIIFAGACQSHFKTLIKAGANFASSPERINIHALDPVYIAARTSMTPFTERISLWEILRNTITGEKGLGGVESRGVMRRGIPLKQEDLS